MKITKRQLRRIIKEEKARIIAEQRDDRAFLQAMETIMDQLMVMDPAARVQNAETLVQNLVRQQILIMTHQSWIWVSKDFQQDGGEITLK